MLTRATIAHPETALTEKSVITLFRQAGFRTVWLTNQGSMATGETWVASIARESEIFRTHPSIYSIGERLEDTDLLPMLDEILAMPPQNTLIVLHSFGSHINPEDRYSDIFRTYAPVCRKFSVSDCTDEELVNSYDNSVLATDFYWAGLVERLKNITVCSSSLPITAHRLRGKYKGHSPELMDNPALRWVPFMLYASPSLRKEESAVRKLSSAESIHMQPISTICFFIHCWGRRLYKLPHIKRNWIYSAEKPFLIRIPSSFLRALNRLPRCRRSGEMSFQKMSQKPADEGEPETRRHTDVPSGRP